MKNTAELLLDCTWKKKREYLLALDGGTGSFRAILFQKTVQKVIEQIEWEHPVYDEYPGSVGFDF